MVTMTEKQLQALFQKKTKGFVTAITKVAEKQMKENIESYLYGYNHVNTKRKTYRPAYGDHNFKRSVYHENAKREGDGYVGEVNFGQSVLQSASEPKTRTYLGRYTDFQGNYVGDELIGNGWLEDGTANDMRPYLSRSGAGFIEATMRDLDDFAIMHELQTYFEGDFDGIRVVK